MPLRFKSRRDQHVDTAHTLIARDGHARARIGLLALLCICFPVIGYANQRPASSTTLDVQMCRGCEITLHSRLMIGALDDDVTLGRASQATLGIDGRYYVAPTADDGEIAIYDTSGHLERVLRRHGRGPGEFAGIRQVLPVGEDSLVVLDSRLTLLGPGDRLISTKSLLDVGFSIARLSWGGYAYNAAVMASPPLEYFGPSLDRGAKFGDIAVNTPDALPAVLRLAAGRRGTLWAAPLNQYQLQEWDSTGHLLRRLDRMAPWFRAWGRRESQTVEATRAPPLPRVLGLCGDARGLLWVLIGVSDPHARRTLSRATNGAEHSVPAVRDWSRQYDTVIEVIDPARQRVIASRRLPQAYSGFAAPGMLYGLREDQDGLIRIAIVGVSLRRSRQ